jgi:hypothetical protein
MNGAPVECQGPKKERGSTMDLKTLHETPPWEWPEGTGKRLGDIQRGRW